jgi:hypothetical protein
MSTKSWAEFLSEIHTPGLQAVDALCEVVDPETEPFKSKEEAICTLDNLHSQACTYLIDSVSDGTVEIEKLSQETVSDETVEIEKLSQETVNDDTVEIEKRSQETVRDETVKTEALSQETVSDETVKIQTKVDVEAVCAKLLLRIGALCVETEQTGKGIPLVRTAVEKFEQHGVNKDNVVELQEVR